MTQASQLIIKTALTSPPNTMPTTYPQNLKPIGPPDTTTTVLKITTPTYPPDATHQAAMLTRTPAAGLTGHLDTIHIGSADATPTSPSDSTRTGPQDALSIGYREAVSTRRFRCYI